ncbi:MAG: hypothetical protein GEV11_20195 [Streptosporangiales bacterium]|nr:hypothetical protein [Streptosporangiales bacterium]
MTLVKSWAVALAVLFAGSMVNAMLVIFGLAGDPGNLSGRAVYLYLPLLLTLFATTFAAGWVAREESGSVLRGVACYTVPGLAVVGGAVVTAGLGTTPIGEVLITLVIGGAGMFAGGLLSRTLHTRTRRRTDPAYY